MAELRPGPRHQKTSAGEVRERRAPPDAPQREHYPHPRQQRHLPVQPGAAAHQLVGHRLVRRRSAAARGGDEHVPEREPVVAAHAGRLIGEAGPVQRRIEEVAAAIAGDHPPRPVAAVRRRREPDDEQPRSRISEAGQRARPVRPVAKPPDLDPRDLLAPGDQARAGAALGDLAVQRAQPAQDPRVPPRPPPRWLPRGMFCAGPRMPNPLFCPWTSLPCGVPRNPPPPPNLPPPCARSSASLTLSGLPPKSLPFSSSMAAFASSSLSRSTKANPRERPVSLSVMIFTERTVRFSPAISCLICASVVSKGRLPTNRRAMSSFLSPAYPILFQNPPPRTGSGAVASCLGHA